MWDESEFTDALRAVIGRAVVRLIRSGQAPHRENILTMLGLMGEENRNESAKALYLSARELISGRLTH